MWDCVKCVMCNAVSQKKEVFMSGLYILYCGVCAFDPVCVLCVKSCYCYRCSVHVHLGSLDGAFRSFSST